VSIRLEPVGGGIVKEFLNADIRMMHAEHADGERLDVLPQVLGLPDFAAAIACCSAVVQPAACLRRHSARWPDRADAMTGDIEGEPWESSEAS
jgi:hypothetical protein